MDRKELLRIHDYAREAFQQYFVGPLCPPLATEARRDCPQFLLYAHEGVGSMRAVGFASPYYIACGR